MAEVNNNNQDNKIECGVCKKNLTLSTLYYKCTECIPEFYWCCKCFTHSEKGPAEDFGEEGKVVTATKAWHIHKCTVVQIDIYTPSKTKYKFD